MLGWPLKCGFFRQSYCSHRFGFADAGAEIIRAGLAWHYVAYARNETTYASLEGAARKSKVGLWQDAAPIAPWSWRKRGKTNAAAGVRYELDTGPCGVQKDRPQPR